MSYKNPAEIAKEVVILGEKKAMMNTLNMLVLGILAGAYIAFGAQLMIVATFTGNLNPSLSRILGGSVFSLGLIIIVLAGAELFTGNSLMTVGLFEKRYKLRALAKNWSIVYLGNFIGAVIIVLIIFYSGLWQVASSAIGAKAVSIAVAKVKLDFLTAVIRGIGANWLVCIAVWLAISGSTSIDKILGIYFPITAFVALGFEHSIANMFFLPTGLFLKGFVSVAGVQQLTLTSIIFNNLIPVTIGNIIGGVLFVALPYWFVYLKKNKEIIKNTPQLSSDLIQKVKVGKIS